MKHQDEQVAFLTIALLAVFSNGGKDERELAQLRRVLEKLSPIVGANLSLVLQEVQLKRRSIQDTVGLLKAPESRQLAFEAAVCVCDVDGVHSDAEHRFLEELRIALGLELRFARSFERSAGAIADLTLQPEPVRGFSAAVDAADSEALNQGISGVASFCAALARLGTSVAALAIVPMQMKMMYRVSKAYGEQAARGQIKDLMVVFGAAALPQFIESLGFSTLAAQAEATTAAFANTYALGHAAKFYYAAELDIDLQVLREQFEHFNLEGQRLCASHVADIDYRSRILNSNDLAGLLRQQ